MALEDLGSRVTEGLGRSLVPVLVAIVTFLALAALLPMFGEAVTNIQNAIGSLFLGSVFGVIIGILAVVAIFGIVLNALKL